MPRVSSISSFVLGLGVVLSLATPAFAANTGQGATWDDVKQLPDWTGVWTWLRNERLNMPVNAKGQAQLDQIAKDRKLNGDIDARAKHCMLEGWPAGPTGPEEYAEEFVYTPGRVTMTQSQGYVRRIYTDGRKHHAGPETLQGDSIGHWEGDTLVVDITGTQHGNELYYGYIGGAHVHGIEHIYLIDADTLTFDIDVDAPDVFTQPWHYSNHMRRHPDWTIVEFNCQQNQRSVDEKGNQTMILDKKSYSETGKE